MTGDEWREKYDHISIDFQVTFWNAPGTVSDKDYPHERDVQRAIGAMDEVARRYGLWVKSATEPQITRSPHPPARDRRRFTGREDQAQ